MAEHYDIQGQQQMEVLNPFTSNFDMVIRVFYATKPHGIAGWVDIPSAGYGPDIVHAAVEAAALNAEAVTNL